MTFANASHNLSNKEIERFSRQLILKGFGPSNQERLKNSSCLVVGAGGLGCPLSIYLAAAGIGRLGIIDHDDVSIDNLHRQVAFNEEQVGQSKADSLKSSILKLNNSITVDTHNQLLSSSNALGIIKDYDVVADCSDNVSTRYLLNDASVLAKKPIVSGSALGWEGQLTVYNSGDQCPCYRCIFPVPPRPDTVANCSDNGVLGPIVGIIGCMQALEVIKLVTTGGSSFAGKLWFFDGLEGRARTISLRERLRDCAVCGTEPTITTLQNYELLCGSGPTDKVRNLRIISSENRISVKEYATSHHSVPLLDVRPKNEYEICHLENSISIPLDELKKMDIDVVLEKFGFVDTCITGDSSLFVICHHGNQSQLAVELLQKKIACTKYHALIVKDIIGGIDQWSFEIDHSFPRY